MGSRVGRLAGAASAARRRLVPSRAHSAVIVPVPSFEPILTGLQRRYGLARPPGLPAHVTVLYPFVRPRQLAAAMPGLVDVAAQHEAFPFALPRFDRFPQVLYAVPEPAQPFARITEAIFRRWPSQPPYGGRFADVVPHCTVVEGSEPLGLADELAASLPVAAVAEELLVVAPSAGRWHTVARVPLAR